MKRLVGGDYLLDISSIELAKSVDGTTKTNITDASIIEQLTNLQKYIANPNMAKPIWIKLYNGETDELVIARGTFANVDTGEFEICVQLDGYKLVIYIEFTQVLNSDDEPMEEWYIDTNDAKYLFTSDAQNVKATIEDANFGDVALAGDLSVGGDASVTGDSSVGGDASVGGDLSVTGDLSGDAITGNSIVENMTGYSCVVYDELPNLNVVYAGVCKNGNKITFALAFDFTTGAEQTSVNGTICAFGIPSDVGAKLYAYADAPFTHTLDRKVLECWQSEASHTDGNEYAYKQSNTNIEINCAVSGLSASTKYICRIEKTFLLSDNLAE